MSGKRKESSSEDRPGSIVGAPDIARPDDRERYERQMAFIYAWFSEMLERVEAGDEKAATAARDELQTLLLSIIGEAVRVALDNKDSKAKEWSGELLATAYVSIDKHDEKIGNANEAYHQEKKKLGKLRIDMLFPPGLIGQAVQRELKTAERYRKTLRLLKAGCGEGSPGKTLRFSDGKGGWIRRVVVEPRRGWKQAAQAQNIPEEYFASVDLPEFSTKSEPQWRKFLWPLIKKHLPKDSWYQRPPGYEGRKRYSSDFQKAAREHLQSLARLRDKRLLC